MKREEKAKIGIYCLLVIAQLVYMIYLCNLNCPNSGDGVFTYNSANNMYESMYFGGEIGRIPNSNGWFSGQVLKNTYEVNSSSRFNYSIPYYHALSDIHPILYFFSVHTISSFFPGHYSMWFSLAVNIIMLLLIDIVIYSMGEKLLNGNEFGILIFVSLATFTNVQVCYNRSYFMLLLACFLYLYIHVSLYRTKKWSKRQLIALFGVILFGELVHYYFYVYAFLVSATLGLILLIRKERYKFLNYLLVAFMAFETGLILYPWVFKHILINDTGKHEVLTKWNITTLTSLYRHLDRNMTNGKMLIFVLIFVFLTALYIVLKKMKKVEKDVRIDATEIMIYVIPFLIYVFLIFTLDGYSIVYYFTPAFPVVFIGIIGVLFSCMHRIWGNKLGRNSLNFIICIIVVAVMGFNGILNQVEHRLQWAEIYTNFHQIAIDNSENDVIYVSDSNDTLYSNLLFELGEYDEVKHVFSSDFNPENIGEYLDGRISNTGDVLMYIPAEIEMPEEYKGADYIVWNYRIYKVNTNAWEIERD